jgi:hypothetical protein
MLRRVVVQKQGLRSDRVTGALFLCPPVKENELFAYIDGAIN